MAGPRPEVFAEIACAAPDLLAFERESLSLLDRVVGFDVAWFAWQQGPSPVAPGLLDSVRACSGERWDRYRQESGLLWPVARRQGGVAIDVEVLGRQRLERLDIYQDLMRPHAGKSTALLFLHVRDQQVGRAVLGRASRARFTPRQQAFLRSAVPVLSLGVSSLAALSPQQPSRPSDALPPLTPREREILAYLPLGYTNRQIALALGTAPRTVRNQLSRLFDKLGVATRAEAVARWAAHAGGDRGVPHATTRAARG